MKDDGFNPAGSGPDPISPRTICELIETAEAALARADAAIQRAYPSRVCDHFVFEEPIADKPNQE